MITNDDWLDFIGNFFRPQEVLLERDVDVNWLKHVVANWNPLLKKTSCGCEWFNQCETYIKMKEAIIETISSN